ncbi:MAG: hypothetical protein M3R15_01670 [Acidobacteriota bacterium]|nr:hypothetical protein [Acidobacteriota bacterium]
MIATSTNTLQQSIGFAGFAPGQVSFFPDSSHVVTGSGSNLLVFDTPTFAVVQTLPVAASGSLAFAADGKVYAPVPGENRVAVLSLSCPSSN